MKHNHPSIKEQEWYSDPFGWYVRNDRPEMMGIKMTDVVALDLLQGLYDVFKSLDAKRYGQAKKDACVLATLVIASCTGYGEEAVEELMVDEFNKKDIDKELNKILDGGLDG